MKELQNMAVGDAVVTDKLTIDKTPVMALVTKCREGDFNKDCRLYYVRLPRASIIQLRDNFVPEFEWEWYCCCIHRPAVGMTVESDSWIAQTVRGGDPSRTRIIGGPKSRSRPIIVRHDSQEMWSHIPYDQYRKFCVEPRIRAFLTVLMHSNRTPINLTISPISLWRCIWTYLGHRTY